MFMPMPQPELYLAAGAQGSSVTALLAPGRARAGLQAHWLAGGQAAPGFLPYPTNLGLETEPSDLEPLEAQHLHGRARTYPGPLYLETLSGPLSHVRRGAAVPLACQACGPQARGPQMSAVLRFCTTLPALFVVDLYDNGSCLSRIAIDPGQAVLGHVAHALRVVDNAGVGPATPSS